MHDTRPHPQAYSFTFQSSTVTYGVLMEHIILHLLLEGLTVTLRFEEHKEADSTTGQAAHMISRGITIRVTLY
ncbi:putative myeloid leukemia factor [Helianthus debilis subsp. tardiflorus]